MIFKDITRGGQATLHGLRMFSQVVSTIIKISLNLMLLITAISLYTKVPQLDWYIGSKFFAANLNKIVGKDIITFQYHGQIKKTSATQFLASNEIQKWKTRTYKNTSSSLAIGGATALLVAIILGFAFRRQSKDTLSKKFIRGAKFAPASKLSKAVTAYNRHGNKSPCALKLANVDMPKNSETQHILMYGAPGSGKTVAINSLLSQIRAQRFKTIVYDIEGVYIPKFYRPGKDIIFNPLDARTPNWNLWKETNMPTDFDDMASSIVPNSSQGLDSFWNTAARNVFSAAAQTMSLEDNPNIHTLLNKLFTSGPKEIESLLHGTMAQTIIEKDAEKTAKSILLTLGTYCKNLQYINDNGINDAFSIKDWVRQDGDSWLFLSTSEQYQASFSSIITMWLDIAISAFLSLPESISRRTFFVLDELTSLGRQPRLRSLLERARKRGGCLIAAMQDFNQLSEVYGTTTANSIQSQVGTTLYFKLNNPDSAKKAASHLGHEEFIQANEGFSVGAHEMRDGVNVNNQTKQDSLIMPSEIMTLEPNQAFLKLSGNWPITKVKFNIKPIANIESSLVERKLIMPPQEKLCDILGAPEQKSDIMASEIYL
jgi:type IV conjugative transfer system coupling protein TraD